MIALARNTELTQDSLGLFTQYQESAKLEAYRFWKQSRDLWSKMEKEDLVQIALLALHEASRAYSVHVGAFWPFACTIIRNRFQDALRASKRAEVAVGEPLAIDPEPYVNEVKDERMASLRFALAQLPGDYYSIYCSRHGVFGHDRKPVKEIALEHGIAVSTVQKRLATAKSLLQSILLT